MMRDTRSHARTAEKVAGVIAVIAALVVLNGAWVNQHTWQNISWRAAMAAMLVGLALAVETNAFGVLPSRRRREDEAMVPDFLRAGAVAQGAGKRDASPASADAVAAGERR